MKRRRRKLTPEELAEPCTRAQMEDARQHLTWLVIIGLAMSLALAGAASFYFSRENDRQRKETVNSAVAKAVPKAVADALVTDIRHERLGCRRLDIVRGSVYSILYNATLAQRHDASALPRGSKQRRRQLADAHDFEKVLRRLLASAQKFARHVPPHPERLPFSKLPKTFSVNCKLAYPGPDAEHPRRR